jgi:tetratricopeptide (TPR) repeat protein
MSMFLPLPCTRSVVIGLVASVSFFASGLAHAQDWKGRGRLEGKVLGPDGTPIAGATVKLENPARGGGPTIKTDKKGKWAYLGLAAGTWNLDMEAAGYATKKVSVALASETERVNPVEVRLETAGPAPAPPEVLEAVRKADEAYKAGRFAEAQAEYEKLLALRPDLATTIHQQMGFSLIQQKKYPEALEHLQKVLDADPTNVPIRVITAQAALEGGLIDRGLALLKSVDESAVKTPDIFFNVGVALINANRPEDAIVYFGKSVALDAAYADGYFRRGLAYLQLGKTAEAKSDLQKFVELTPTGAEADLARKALAQLK